MVDTMLLEDRYQNAESRETLKEVVEILDEVQSVSPSQDLQDERGVITAILLCDRPLQVC